MRVTSFRIIRDTDIEIQEDEWDDLLLTMRVGLRQRCFVATVCVWKSAPVCRGGHKTNCWKNCSAIRARSTPATAPLGLQRDGTARPGSPRPQRLPVFLGRALAILSSEEDILAHPAAGHPVGSSLHSLIS
ncbi:MAG: hypothetical protein IPH87_27810 [Anaerolineae bacterium]|nr:hypothetical protein [Anaerolineae bacterium]